MAMVAFFEDSSYYANLEHLFKQRDIAATGWRDYQNLEKRLKEVQPEVVLLDIQIKGETEAGLEALKIIREKFPAIKTIMLTAHRDYVIRAFRAGADGYLLKEEISDSLEYILELAQGINTNRVPISEEIKRILVEYLRPAEKNQMNLIARERQIIYLAASDKNVPQIAKTLGLTNQTIETYLRNIRGKLDCHTIQGVVSKAYQLGVIDVGG